MQGEKCGKCGSTDTGWSSDSPAAEGSTPFKHVTYYCCDCDNHGYGCVEIKDFKQHGKFQDLYATKAALRDAIRKFTRK